MVIPTTIKSQKQKRARKVLELRIAFGLNALALSMMMLVSACKVEGPKSEAHDGAHAKVAHSVPRTPPVKVAFEIGGRVTSADAIDAQKLEYLSSVSPSKQTWDHFKAYTLDRATLLAYADAKGLAESANLKRKIDSLLAREAALRIRREISTTIKVDDKEIEREFEKRSASKGAPVSKKAIRSELSTQALKAALEKEMVKIRAELGYSENTKVMNALEKSIKDSMRPGIAPDGGHSHGDGHGHGQGHGHAHGSHDHHDHHGHAH